jgi:hypothetical protein
MADSYNKEAARYLWFVIRGNGEIYSGYEFRDDAKEDVKELKEHGDVGVKISYREKIDPAKLAAFYKAIKVPQRMLDKGLRDAKKDAKKTTASSNGYSCRIKNHYG